MRILGPLAVYAFLEGNESGAHEQLQVDNIA
jgi:hypothetical protein